MDCLEKYHNNWPKDGILQVQIVKNQVKLAKQSTLPPFFASKWNHSFILGDTKNRSTTVKDGQCSLEQKHNGRISHEVELKDNELDPIFVDTAVIDEGYLLKRETVYYEKKIQATQINRFPLYSSYFPSMQQLIHCKHFEIVWHKKALLFLMAMGDGQEAPPNFLGEDPYLSIFGQFLYPFLWIFGRQSQAQKLKFHFTLNAIYEGNVATNHFPYS